MQPFQLRKLTTALGLTGKDEAKAAAKVIEGLAKVFFKYDASLAEINPLVLTKTGELLAIDAKLNFDDNALFRHPEIEALHDPSEENPAETRAKAAGLSYIALDGNIGCLVNGAGLAMATMDLIKLHGGDPANFLDVGGSVTTEGAVEAFRILLGDRKVKGVLVNIFGGIAKCDLVAEALVAAAREVGFHVPVVVRLEGTNVDRAPADPEGGTGPPPDHGRRSHRRRSEGLRGPCSRPPDPRAHTPQDGRERGPVGSALTTGATTSRTPASGEPTEMPAVVAEPPPSRGPCDLREAITNEQAAIGRPEAPPPGRTGLLAIHRSEGPRPPSQAGASRSCCRS